MFGKSKSMSGGQNVNRGSRTVVGCECERGASDDEAMWAGGWLWTRRDATATSIVLYNTRLRIDVRKYYCAYRIAEPVDSRVYEILTGKQQNMQGIRKRME